VLNREGKEALVHKVHEKLKSAEAVYLVDYRGLNVAEISELRRKLREASCEFEVVKNTLLRRAAEGTDAATLAEYFKGPVALTVTQADPVAPAKVLSEFSKGAPHLELRVGLLSGQLLEVGEIKKLASLPSFDELRASLLSLLNAPAGRLVRLIAAPGGQLARAVALRRDQLPADGVDNLGAAQEAPA
jgi:large subunit ribosomal protein L10